MVVVGSMIGSGIFLMSAETARILGSPGWLLASWLITGALTMAASLAYGELAGMMPKAGGQYVYLREAWSPLWGFLYGWTFFLVMQAGGIAAVSVGFARYTGVFFPRISDSQYLIAPVHLTRGYALSLSTTQALAIAVIALLTWSNTRGLSWGRLIQNVFTSAKTAALAALIVVGLLLGWNHAAVAANFNDLWTPRGAVASAGGSLDTAFGLFVAVCLAQIGCLFAANAWNYVTFTAGEVKNPRRDIPLSLAVGTGLVIALYLLANLAYLVTLPLAAIQAAPADRVASLTLESVWPGLGGGLMAVAIMVSTFGCANGLILTGARAAFAMSRDGLFFKRASFLNQARVPGFALVLQGTWTSALVLPRTVNPETGAYGNLYGNLLDYVISAELFFYVLTIAAVFRLRRLRPQAERPYRAFGYPLVPALYITGAVTLLAVLLIYKPTTTWPGFAIVAIGLPVFTHWNRKA